VVDTKVYLYAMGMVQAFFKLNELPVLKQWRGYRKNEREIVAAFRGCTIYGSLGQHGALVD
jgi:hypothetical protein